MKLTNPNDFSAFRADLPPDSISFVVRARRSPFGWGLMIGVLGMLLAGCAEEIVEVEDSEAPFVEALEVETKTIHPTLELTGSVVSQEIARIHPEISGTVEKVLVREGDRIEKGQVLAELDPSDYTYRLQIAQAERLKASAEYSRILRGYRPEDIEASRKVYENARAIYQARNRNLERNQILFEAGTMTERDWTVFLEELAAAGAMVGKVSAELTKMEAGYESYDIQAASAALLLAEANESLALRELENTRITSPIEGVVSRRDVEIGQLVGPGQVVFEIQNPDKLWLLAEASAKDAGMIRIGQKADLFSDTLQSTHPGRVERVAETLNPNTKSLAVWFAWEGVEVLPPIASFATGTIHLDPIPDVVALQRQWIHLERGVHFVWTVRDGVLERRNIRIGKDRGEEVIVDAGLEPGASLVISPPTAFEDGLAVRVGKASSNSEDVDGEEGVLTLSMYKADSEAH